jgi:hypothetical protein
MRKLFIINNLNNTRPTVRPIARPARRVTYAAAPLAPKFIKIYK